MESRSLDLSAVRCVPCRSRDTDCEVGGDHSFVWCGGQWNWKGF